MGISVTLNTVEDLGSLLPLAKLCRKCDWHHQSKMEPQESALEGAKKMLDFWINMGSQYLFSNIK